MEAPTVTPDGYTQQDQKERWALTEPPPYILTREDAKNLRLAFARPKLQERIASFKALEPLFGKGVWEQVLAHIEGMEG